MLREDLFAEALQYVSSINRAIKKSVTAAAVRVKAQYGVGAWTRSRLEESHASKMRFARFPFRTKANEGFFDVFSPSKYFWSSACTPILENYSNWGCDLQQMYRCIRLNRLSHSAPWLLLWCWWLAGFLVVWAPAKNAGEKITKDALWYVLVCPRVSSSGCLPNCLGVAASRQWYLPRAELETQFLCHGMTFCSVQRWGTIVVCWELWSRICKSCNSNKLPQNGVNLLPISAWVVACFHLLQSWRF